MIFPRIQGAPRPNRLSEEKDKDYHCRWGRHILEVASGDQVLVANAFKYHINWNFYKGNQWIFNEDLEAFLKDNTNGMRNRVRWVFNQIMGQVHTLSGHATAGTYIVRAHNSTPSVSKFKEQERRKRLTAFNLAQAYPEIAGQMQARYDLGETAEETNSNFERSWTDYSSIAVNALFRRIEKLNDFDGMKEELAETLAIGGYAVAKPFFRGKEMYWEHIDLRQFIWDTRARKKNFSDAEWMGDMELPIATELFEQYPHIGTEAMEAIETAIQRQRPLNQCNREFLEWFGMALDQIMPKYNLYWHDTEKQAWGHVLDADHRICLKRIFPDGHVDDNTGEPAKYTESMVLPREYLATDAQKKLVEDHGMTFRYPDIIRHICFTPKEFVGTEEDVLYSNGIVPYQETYENMPWDSVMPYKVSTFIYRNGEVVAPIDNSIDGQRMMNRFLSMSESQASHIRGANVFYDKVLVADEANGEFELQDKMNRGEPIGVDGSMYGGNIQNAVIPYNGAEGIRASIGMMDIVARLREFNQTVSNVTDSVMGQSGDDTPVGIQEQNILQGNIVNRKFYNGLSKQFLSIYKAIGVTGLRFYAENESEFEDMIGPEAFMQVKFQKEMAYHQFYVTLRLISNHEAAIEANNQRLIELYSFGVSNPAWAVIGREEFAHLYNSAETDQVRESILQYVKKAEIVAEEYERQMQAEKEEQIGLMREVDQKNKEHDINKIYAQGDTKMRRERLVGINKLLQLKMKKDQAMEKNMVPGRSVLAESQPANTRKSK